MIEASLLSTDMLPSVLMLIPASDSMVVPLRPGDRIRG